MLMDILLIILKVILWLIAIALFFRLSNKIVMGTDEYFDNIFNKIKELYGFIRKYFRKEGHKIDVNGRTDESVGKDYDSSSVWED
jgi:hypothetical protein